MRREVDASRIRELLRRLGQQARGPGRVYLTGGATALLLGWRETTLDVDLSFDPEPAGIFESIARMKDELNLNIELASPAHFLPTLPGWQARSLYIDKVGSVEFFHYDPYSQALSKIERDHARDALDVSEMINRGLVERGELKRLFEIVRPDLIRFPSVDEDSLSAKLEEVIRKDAEQ